MDPKRKALLISQELFFAKALAGNDVKQRERALKKLYRWLYARTHDCDSGFNTEDFMRLWKGLFYCMWMSDKPLVQEEVAENISKLIHSVGEGADLFAKCFFLTMIHEWNGIDQHRLDKFNMLVRRFLRQTLEWARKSDWSVGAPKLMLLLEQSILKPAGAQEGLPIGLLLHFSDIFLEEVAKTVDENGEPPNSDVVIQLLRPFARLVARNNDPRIVNSVMETVFHHIMRQSDVGLDYEELRKNGWLQRRQQELEDEVGEEDEECSEDGSAEEEEEEEEEEEGGAVLNAKDPRAGGVDVVLPQLDIDLEDLASMLEDEVKDSTVRPKLRRKLEDLAQKFRSITRGRYPLQIGTVSSELKWKKAQRTRSVRKAALNLIKEEEKLLMAQLRGDDELPKSKPIKLNNGKLPTGENAKMGRKRKRGKRKTRQERKKAIEKKGEQNEKKVEQSEKKVVQNEKKVVQNEKKVVQNEKKVVQNEKKIVQNEKKIEQNGVEKKVKVSPPKKRRMIDKGWHVNELKTPLQEKRVLRNSSVGGMWTVENCGKERNNSKGAKSAKLRVSEDSVKDSVSGEMEIVIKNLRPNPFSPFGRKIVTPKSLKKGDKVSEVKCKTPSSDKRVKIVLSRNLAQETHEYQKSLRASPAIPFDPTKVPAQGVLKATSSPIMLNPFFRTSPRTPKKVFP